MLAPVNSNVMCTEMNRQCPNCGEPAIRFWRLLFGNTRCRACSKIVGAHWLYSAAFFIIGSMLFLAGVLTLVNALGIKALIPAILLWLAVEVLREILVPLEVKQSRFA